MYFIFTSNFSQNNVKPNDPCILVGNSIVTKHDEFPISSTEMVPELSMAVKLQPVINVC